MKNVFRTTAVLAMLVALATPALAQRPTTERFRNRDVVSQEIIVRFRGADAEAMSRSVRSRDSDIASASPVGRSGAIRLHSRARNVAALIAAYASRPDVEYAEPNYLWRSADVPNDVLFTAQWALQNTGQVVAGQAGTAGADIKATQAWDVAEGSRGIVVGMIDSGIDYTHPDLIGNMWSAPSSFSVTISGQTITCAAGTHGFNAITRTCDPMDDEGHGTYTAGIVGASGNNAVAISGVSRVASLMALEFLGSDGTGSTTDAIAAIEFAIQVKAKFPTDANVRVLNASWGGTDFSQALLDEINLAGSKDVLFVASAGNSSANLDSAPEYPAAYNAANLISVAATDNRDQLASFSNYGSTTVHLGAPGVEILSTLRGKFYGSQSGTSASAPMVSGAAALVLSACALNTAALKASLLSSVDAIPALTGITTSGGRLNVNSAVRSCAGLQPATFTLGISPAAQNIAGGAGAQFMLQVNPLNGFAGPLTFSATGLPSGVSASFAPNGTAASSVTLSIDAVAITVPGTYLIGIVAAGNGVTRTIGIIVTIGTPAGCVLDPSLGSVSGRLDTFDAISIHRSPAFADFCTFTLDSDKAVTITMQSSQVNSFIYLLSSDGTVLASNDNGPNMGNNSQIQALLPTGAYTVEATTASSGQTGNYSLQLSLTHPTVTSVSPNFGTEGTSVDITLTGTVFFGSPFLVKVSNCAGAVVSNIQIINTTTATATVALPNSILTCAISASNPGGDSTTLSFTINPPRPTITNISPDSGLQGQFVPVTITGTNFVDNLSFSLNGVSTTVVSHTATTISTNFNLSIDYPPGTYLVRVTNAGGFSNPLNFTVLLAPPTLGAISPSAGGPGQNVNVEMAGTGFVSPVVVNAGPKITVTKLTLNTPDDMTATFNIAPDATLGDYPITVSTAGGISAARTFTLLPPPLITSITPGRAFVGTTTSIVLTGTNFVCPVNFTISGGGAVILPGVNCSSASIAFNVQVSDTATIGTRALSFFGPNGISNSVALDITPVPPIIQSITPPYGGQTTSAQVTLTGSGMASGTVSVSGGGVTANTLSSSATGITVSLSIAANAAIGPRDLTVTGATGTSDPVTFTVTPPTWPDFSISQTIPAQLASGFDETWILNVRNDGEKANVNPVTITDNTIFNVALLSVSPGWTCSSAGQTFTCTSPGSIAPHTTASVAVTLHMPGLNGFFQNTTTVTSDEDYNVANNSSVFTGQIVVPPVPKLVTASSIQPGQQGTVSLALTTPFFHDITGTVNSLSLSFSPSTAGAAMDPALQFATGGQQVNYIIRANTLQAEFQGVPGPLGYQAGTVAGTITFKATFKAGTNGTQTLSSTTTIPATIPALSSATAEPNSSGFVAAVSMLSSTREVRSLTVTFNTTAPVTLSCGALPGCTARGSTITFDVTSIFNAWYSSNPASGGLAILRVPFSIQGKLSGTVSVGLTNTVGASNTMSFTIP